MKRILVFLLSLFSVTACHERVNPAHQSANVTYESDTTSTDDESDAGARVQASPSGKLTFEYLNNETEIFRPSTYTIRLWAVDEIADPSRAYIDGLGDGKYDAPTYTVPKKTGRSYVRKTVKAGWYLAEFDGSGQFFKFNVTAGSDGLLIYNEHDFNSSFRGYFSNYGKIKVGWKKAPGQDANAVISFSGATTTNVWFYAEDGAGATKYQYWFMPSGTYNFTVFGDSGPSGSVTVASGKTYPFIKI